MQIGNTPSGVCLPVSKCEMPPYEGRISSIHVGKTEHFSFNCDLTEAILNIWTLNGCKMGGERGATCLQYRQLLFVSTSIPTSQPSSAAAGVLTSAALLRKLLRPSAL